MIKLLLALLACSPQPVNITDSGSKAPPKIGAEPIAPELGIQVTPDCRHAAAGDKVCNFILRDQDGKLFELYEHEGKVIVLDFATSWCPPCQEAGMYVQGIQDDYEDEIVFVTVLLDGYTYGEPPTLAELEAWVDTHNITTAPVLFGSREMMTDFAGDRGYIVTAFPTYVYINRNLILAGSHSGFADAYVRNLIDQLL